MSDHFSELLIIALSLVLVVGQIIPIVRQRAHAGMRAVWRALRPRQWILPRVILLALVGTAVLIAQRHSGSPRARAQQEQQSWAAVRATIPTSIIVLRPAWLPPRFRPTSVGADSVTAAARGGRALGGYDVWYCVAACQRGARVEFILNDDQLGRSGSVPWGAPVHVGETVGYGVISWASSSIAITWREGGQRYMIEGRDVNRADLLRVAAHLTVVTGAS